MRPTPAIDEYIAPLFCTTDEKPLLFALELELLGAPPPHQADAQNSIKYESWLCARGPDAGDGMGRAPSQRN